MKNNYLLLAIGLILIGQTGLMVSLNSKPKIVPPAPVAFEASEDSHGRMWYGHSVPLDMHWPETDVTLEADWSEPVLFEITSYEEMPEKIFTIKPDGTCYGDRTKALETITEGMRVKEEPDAAYIANYVSQYLSIVLCEEAASSMELY